MGKRIIIIDDSLTIRKVLEITLTRAGFLVSTYANGFAAALALSARHNHHGQPAAIFLDIEMPRMDGYETTRLLKSWPHLASTRFIMLSCRDSQLDRIKARVLGVDLYLTKPCPTQTILYVAQLALLAQSSGHA